MTASTATMLDQQQLIPIQTQGNLPTRLPSQPSSVQIYDALEKEQEAIVNRLQRELSLLREEQSGGTGTLSASSSHSHSQRARSPIPPQSPIARHRRADSTSSSSLSRNPSVRSVGYNVVGQGSSGGIVGTSAISDSEDAGSTTPGGYGASGSLLTGSSRRSSRRSFGSTSGMSSAEDLYISSLRKENEALKKRLMDMTKLLNDKEAELDQLRKIMVKDNTSVIIE
ncbi:hypothetical protein V1511DRAFT_485535 [Dipodascopsis uninucleata]